ncbi:MAG: TraB domain-containing protein, partial [Syntrophales bacterium LBB04]|nr:TraB domain-containing protein [Syntrophales bacterium LBB04]
PRYMAVRSQARPDSEPFTTSLRARYQRRIAKEYGSLVGDEMLAGIDTARELKIPFAFIDNITPMGNEGVSILTDLPWREKAALLFGALASVFVHKKHVEKGLKEFEENRDEYMAVMEQKFPRLKRMLIDDRDRAMAREIRKLHARFGRIVAVVGDGHVPGMSALLKDLEVNVIRLKQVRGGKGGAPPAPRHPPLKATMHPVPVTTTGGTTAKSEPGSAEKVHQVSFTIEYKE